MIKLLVDENVHSGIIADLKKQKIDIVSVVDIGLTGAKDSALIDYSIKQDRVLITGDKDFGGILEFGILYGKGKVVLLRYNILNIKRISTEILHMLKREETMLQMTGSVLVVLSEGRYRIHHS